MWPFPQIGSFESTKVCGTTRDILSTTRHDVLWKHDLDLLRHAGVEDVRYPAPWHRIEKSPGEFDWAWMDGPMRYFERQRMRPMLDPLHLTSFPDWLIDGISNPQFPELYARFVACFAERYPWVRHYTLFNEPLPTAVFSALMGVWYPYRKSEPAFVYAAVQAAKAMCRAAGVLKRRDRAIVLSYVDTGEAHAALDKESEEWAAFANERRFLIHDLTLGRVDRRHPLYSYLRKNGLRDDDCLWLQDHRAEVDVIGLDYYYHSEIPWVWNREAKRHDRRFPSESPRGFASVAEDYAKRFRLPLFLSETNIRGTIYDRMTWLKYMQEQCEMLVERGTPFRGFCWFPSIDSTDWMHFCTKCTESIDPQGIWWLDDNRWERHASELSEVYACLAQGRATSRDLPAYHLQAPVDRELRGFLGFMKHWPRWREPGSREQAA